MSAFEKIIAVCKSDMDDEMLDLAHEAERELAARDAEIVRLRNGLREVVTSIEFDELGLRSLDEKIRALLAEGGA